MLAEELNRKRQEELLANEQERLRRERVLEEARQRELDKALKSGAKQEVWKPSAANRGTGTLSPKQGQFWTTMDGTIIWSRHGKSPPPVAPNQEEDKQTTSEANKIPGKQVVLPPRPPPIPEDQKTDYMKMLDNINRATKEERERKNNPPPPPKVPEAVRRHAEAIRQQQADEVPVYQPKLPSKQEKLLKDLEDSQRIRKPGEPPPSPPKVYPISGGAALNLEIPTEDPPKTKYEELQRELASLESQYQRMNTLKERKWNHLGQKLLSYEEGFTWCPKCHYVSNISLQSELRHRCGLRGCQRRSCEECYQWDKVSPYEEDDFLYEGPKQKRICEAYWKGTVGCTEGNKCLDHHQFWPLTKENEGRCFVCGMKDGQEGSHRSNHCERPGGGCENDDIAAKVDSFLIPKLPKRPNGESPRQVRVNEVGRRSRSRLKSRSHHRHQKEDDLPHGISPWEYGEKVEEQRIHATKALSTARRELARSGQVSEDIERILRDIMQRYPDLEVNEDI